MNTNGVQHIVSEPILRGAPGKRDGTDGDKRYSYVPNKGLFHFVKYNGQWHSSPLYEEHVGAITKAGVSTENITSTHDIRLAPGKNVELKEKRAIGTGEFDSGFLNGSGWRMRYEDNEYNLECDSLTVRGTMHVFELLIQQLRATNGTVIVSSAAKVDSTSGSAGSESITFDDPSGHSVCPFLVDDIILCQRVRLSGGNIVKRLVRRVHTVTGATITVRSDLSDQPGATGTVEKGDDFVRIGNVNVVARRGGVIISSDLADAPFVEVFDGVSNWTTWIGTDKTKARLGQLSGISDADAGLDNDTKFGLYTNDVNLKGRIHAVDGKIGGVNIEAGKVYAGTGTHGAQNTGFYVDSGGDFSLGSKLVWDASANAGAGELAISGTITATTANWNKDATTTFTSAVGSIPTSIRAGDIWFTTDTYKYYIAAAAGATAIASGQWVLRADTTYDQSSIIDAKATTYRAAVFPNSNLVGYRVGDMWIDTDDGDRPNTCTTAYTGDGSTDHSAKWVTAYTQISGGSITTGAIDADLITTGAIDADLITTGTLDADVVNVTNVLASNIKAEGTITGSTIKSGTGDKRVEISHANNNVVVYKQIDAGLGSEASVESVKMDDSIFGVFGGISVQGNTVNTNGTGGGVYYMDGPSSDAWYVASKPVGSVHMKLTNTDDSQSKAIELSRTANHSSAMYGMYINATNSGAGDAIAIGVVAGVTSLTELRLSSVADSIDTTPDVLVLGSGVVEKRSHGGWTTVTFNTGWEDYDTDAWPSAAYMKDFTDRVYLRGLVKRVSGSETLVFTLPSGYQPHKRCMFAGATGGGHARIDVWGNGTVTIESTYATYLSLDGITFDLKS